MKLTTPAYKVLDFLFRCRFLSENSFEGLATLSKGGGEGGGVAKGEGLWHHLAM